MTPNQLFVDALRECLGLGPLYRAEERSGRSNYQGFEKLRRAADPQCRRCGGSGYYDGEENAMRCPCTGIAQRAKPVRSKKKKRGKQAYRGVLCVR